MEHHFGDDILDDLRTRGKPCILTSQVDDDFLEFFGQDDFGHAFGHGLAVLAVFAQAIDFEPIADGQKSGGTGVREESTVGGCARRLARAFVALDGGDQG